MPRKPAPTPKAKPKAKPKPKAKAKAKPEAPLSGLRAGVEVSVGTVAIHVPNVGADRAVEVAMALKRGLHERAGEYGDLAVPKEFVQIGGYDPLPVDDDGTYARHRPDRIGFNVP